MGRDAWLDNVKMTLVTVVVMGHTLPLFRGDGLNERVYDFVYLWHIPAFVLVTGYLSRSFTWSRRHLWGLFCTIAVPYLLFEGLMLGYRLLLDIPGDLARWPDDAWTNPHWPMWYLTAVLLWRLATPVLKAHWAMLPLAVAASLVFPVVGSDFLDLNRVMGLLPFFVLGLHLQPGWLAALRTRAAAGVGAVVLALLFWLAGHTDQWIATKWLWHAFDYDYFGASLAEGAWNRIRVIGLALAGSLAVLALVPRRRSWYTELGAATLVVYLFHGFVIKAADKLLAGSPLTTTYSAWAVWPALAAAVLVSLLLAWRPVSSRLAWVVDPIGSAQRAA